MLTFMKRKNKIYLLPLLGLLVFGQSCTKNYKDVNTNKNAIATIGPVSPEGGAIGTAAGAGRRFSTHPYPPA